MNVQLLMLFRFRWKRLRSSNSECVLPVYREDKKPIIKRWQQLATNDPEQISKWARKYPDCNWGIATGKKSKVFVVDVDGEVGAKTIAEWTLQLGDAWRQTLTCITAHGSHLYFSLGQLEVKNSVKQMAPGIDVQGMGVL